MNAYARYVIKSYNLNFDIFFRTHIFKKIEYRINKMNRASNNYNEFNVE